MKANKFQKFEILQSNSFDNLKKSILSSILVDDKLYSIEEANNILNSFLRKEI